MLVLSREVGESVLIEDVLGTVVRASSDSIDMSFVKKNGGRNVLVTFRRNQVVEICYNVQAVLIRSDGKSARLGFEYPKNDVHVSRAEMVEGDGPPCL